MKIKTNNNKVNKAWLNNHVNDTYVKLAQKEGYRARAAYKLLELDETFGLVKPGALVVDLGCTPGAWSQYMRRRMSAAGKSSGNTTGRVLALDMLPMEPIEGVEFILGDFREEDVLHQLEAALAGRKVDLVVSDMAPNLSGISGTDGARVALLIELALEFANTHLVKGGNMVAKVFHGPVYNELVAAFKKQFKQVKAVKPKASRPGSTETFLVGLGQL
jgi:23S rRNA (uridine2552-2'-O)-methyltransferase